MPIEFTKISAQRLLELPRERTMFFFPVGPLEDHGPHLPLGLDLLEAQRLCELMAQRLETELPGWTGVIMPAAPLGLEGDTTTLALTVRAHVLRDWLVDGSRGLIRAGFRYFGCMSGHLGPRQLTAIEEAGRMVSRRDLAHWLRVLKHGSSSTQAIRPILVSLRSGSLSPIQVRKSPLWPDPSEHGGQQDTSVALHVCPELVAPDASNLPQKGRLAKGFWARAWLRQQRQTHGYWGRPSLGNADFGRTTLEGTINEIIPQLKSVLSGANPNRIFRSWYSALLPNKSFFKAWLLAIVLALMITVWLYVFIVTVTAF